MSPGRHDRRAQASAGRRPDASMTLIREMMERPLDPGYQAAADRREAAGLPRATSLRSPLLVGAALGIGLVVGVAASNLTATDSPRAAARTELVQQIETRRTQVDELSVRAQQLQSEVTALETAQLPASSEASQARRLAEATGAVALQGPGLTVTLDDAPDAGTDPSSDSTDQKRVVSRDLQFVTNALWEAGAEAISINGNRLTSLSAIRFAGSAIVVDYRPLSRPYVVTALGDPAQLPAAFADGPGGGYITTLHSTFGIRADTEVSDDLTVPAAVGLTTRYASVSDTGATPKSGAATKTDTGGSS